MAQADSPDFTLDTIGGSQDGGAQGSGGLAQADSPDFTLDTIGGPQGPGAQGSGGLAQADSPDFTLDTIGGPQGVGAQGNGGLAQADSPDFTLDTIGGPQGVGAQGIGGLAQADSPDFTLDTIGGLQGVGAPGNGGLAQADSPDFTLDTIGGAQGVAAQGSGGLAQADSADFTLDTIGGPQGGGGLAQADSLDFTVDTTASTPPVILTQPTSLEVIAGNDATFTVRATGLPIPVYQWRLNNGDIPGATASSYTRANAQAGAAGSYSAVAINLLGSVTSAVATLVVHVPPFIATPPQSQTVLAGLDATFSVGAGGDLPLGYQWRFNGVDLAGATGASYTRSSAQTNQAGSYSVVVSNAYGSAASGAATLTVTPVGFSGLTNVVVMEGATTNLTIQATDMQSPLVSLQLDPASASPPFASLSGVVFSNTPTSGLATGTLQLNPAYGDAGSYAITLRAAAANGDSSTFPVTVTVVTNPAVGITRWINTNGGNWSSSANWTAGLPDSTHAAVIDKNGNYTVILDTSPSIAGLTLGGSNGTQTLKLEDPYQPSLTLNGVSVIRSNGVFNSEAVRYGDALAGSGNLTVAGTMNWSAGYLAPGGEIIVASGATLNITGSDQYIDRTLRNFGTVRYTGGTIHFNNSAFDNNNGLIQNEAGGTFITDGGGIFQAAFSGHGTVNNAGTFVKTNSGNTLFNYLIRFNNTGVVNMQAGTLQLQGGGLWAGTVNGLGGTNSAMTGVLQLIGGSYNLNAGSFLNQGSLTANGVDTLNINSAAVGNFTNLSFSGTVLTVNADYTLASLTLNGDLAGSKNLTVTNSGVWGSGYLRPGAGELIVESNAVFNITGTDPYIDRTLRNFGTVRYTGGTFHFNNSTFDNNNGLIQNEAGGTFITDGGGGFQAGATGNGMVNNAGTFVKTNSGTTLFYGMSLNKTGVVNIQTGTLQLRGNGTHTGQFNSSAGTTLTFFGGLHRLNAGCFFGGTGTVRVQTDLQLGAPVSFSTVNAIFESSASVSGGFAISNLSGGGITAAQSITFPGPLDIGGAFTVNSPNVSDSGVFTLEATGVLTNAGTSFSVCKFLNNGGTIVGNPPLVTCGSLQITAQPQDQNVSAGQNATFTVGVSGNPPVSYQWRFNGVNLSGATNPSFTRSGAQSGDAGGYSVVVTNVAGSVASAVATLTVNAPAATPALLSAAAYGPGGQLQFTVTGTTGVNYVVQVSTNLAESNWVPLCTNAAPFTFTDTQAGNDPQRFYRAVYVP